MHSDAAFELATCHTPTVKPWTCSSAGPKRCVTNNNSAPIDNTTVFKTQQECAAKCIAPPPPPLSTNPCVSSPLHRVLTCTPSLSTLGADGKFTVHWAALGSIYSHNQRQCCLVVPDGR